MTEDFTNNGRREQDMSVFRNAEEGQGMQTSRSEAKQPASAIAAAHHLYS